MYLQTVNRAWRLMTRVREAREYRRCPFESLHGQHLAHGARLMTPLEREATDSEDEGLLFIRWKASGSLTTLTPAHQRDGRSS